jgi:hypothetical protein
MRSTKWLRTHPLTAALLGATLLILLGLLVFYIRIKIMFNKIHIELDAKMDNIHSIEATKLYSSLYRIKNRLGMRGEKSRDDGWEYYWLVDFDQGVDKYLVYVRVKGGQVQKRESSRQGEEIWTDVE